MKIEVFGVQNKTIKVKKGDNLLDVLLDEGYEVKHPCDGKGKCGKCKVTVVKKKEEGLGEGKRKIKLACEVKIKKPMQVYLSDKKEKSESK